MNHQVNKKVRRLDDDLIRTFPVEIICYILSFLPIKEAVRTCVLSTNWENKWTFMPDITIDDSCKSFYGKFRVAKFVSVVDRILFVARNDLRSFSLTCEKMYDSNYIVNWISEVLRRRLENLVIVVPRVRDLDLTSRCFERCTSLIQLKIVAGYYTLTLPTPKCLLNLKSLTLGGDFGIKLLNHQFERWGQGRGVLDFPKLESLELKNCNWLNVKSMAIRAPNLITCTVFNLLEENDYSIHIFGPKLATFESSFSTTANYVLHAKAVTTATLGYSASNIYLPRRAHSLLKGFPGLTCLIISGMAVQALARDKSGNVIPTFLHLKQLELDSSCSTSDLLEFLKAVPFLESLKLDVWTWHGYGTEDLEVNNVPPCITSCLKEVEFLKLDDKDGQVELAKFILKTAENLQSMLVTIRRTYPPQKGMKKRLLSALIPKSPTCVVKVKY